MLRSLLFAFLFLMTPLCSETIQLKGHLGKDELSHAKEQLQKTTDQTLILEVNSTSADLNALLDFLKQVYAKRARQRGEVIVYIEDNAVGPAAIIPFLADKLYISYFVSWGDIPLGTREVLPTNILRNRVISLIPADNPKAELLRLMASGMSDPAVEINKNGIASKVGETLVVNHNQMQQLGLVTEVMSLTKFRKDIEKIKEPESVIAPTVVVSGKDIDSRLKKYIKYDLEGPNVVGLIKIANKKEAISQSTWVYIKNALDQYKEIKPKFVILELNTPGGEVFSAQKISDALKELDTQYNIPVVCYINNWAISAGAMIAYSCRFITVVKDGAMGAAEPIQMGEGGKMTTASEKVNSALRADFANRASFFDRNPDIAEAMVDKDIILVWRHGKVVRLAAEDEILKRGPNPDVVISAKGKLLTLSAVDLMEYGVADLLLPPAKLELMTPEEQEIGVFPASKSLIFQHPFFKEIPSATIKEYKMDWKTRFFVILANPMVASLLFLGMMLGFYVEINSPGFGFPGSIGMACLSLMVISSFALEIANVLELTLLLIGLIFIALDLILIPTFGVLGIVGIVFFLIGLFGMLLPGIGGIDFEFDTQTFNAAGDVFIERLAWLSGTLVLGVIVIALLGRYVMPSFSGFTRLVLQGHEENASEGYVAGAVTSSLPQPGSKGEVQATLRPSGKVLIDNEIFDAMTSGGFIEKGTSIVVKRLDGSVIVVDKQE